MMTTKRVSSHDYGLKLKYLVLILSFMKTHQGLAMKPSYLGNRSILILLLKLKSIYKFGLSVCLSGCLPVCLYPKNVKTAELIGPKFVVGHLGTLGKVYESSKFQIFVSIKIRSSLNF